MYNSVDNFLKKLRYKILFKNLPKNIKSEFLYILDIGCGVSPWFFHLPQDCSDNVNITGIDSVDFNFKNAPIKFNYIQLQIDKNLPFNDGQFDLITMLAVLEHLKNREIILSEIYRILKPNGALILTVPTKLAKPILEFAAFNLHLINEEWIKDHKIYFDKKSLRKIFEKTGFKIEKLHYFEMGMNLFAKATKKF